MIVVTYRILFHILSHVDSDISQDFEDLDIGIQDKGKKNYS